MRISQLPPCSCLTTTSNLTTSTPPALNLPLGQKVFLAPRSYHLTIFLVVIFSSLPPLPILRCTSISKFAHSPLSGTCWPAQCTSPPFSLSITHNELKFSYALC